MSDRQTQAPSTQAGVRKPISTKKTRSRKRVFFGAGIFAGLAAVGVVVWNLLGGFQPATAAVESGPDYYTATVTRGDLRVSVIGTGTLVAYQSIDLSFTAGGAVTELTVKAGDPVTKGQILAKVDNQTSLEAAVASAELVVLEARQALSDLRGNANLALAQAYQDWITAQQDYETAEFNLQRSAYARCSQEKNTQLAQRVDTSKTCLEYLSISSTGTDAWVTAKSEYDTAVANYAYCLGYSADEVTQFQAELDIAVHTLTNAEEKYNTLKNASGIDPDELALAEAEVRNAETTLAEAEENLNGVTLVAPIDGRVIYLAASEGAIVDTSRFITIADVSRPTITVTVDETNLDQLVIGRSAEVTFDALPDAVYKGQVVQVDPELSSFGQYSGATGKVELDEEAAAALAVVPLGLSGTVEIISQSAENALLVPIEALRDLGDGNYAVFVLGNDGQLSLHTVGVGIQDSTQAEITSGLQVGDVVSTGLIQAGN